MAKYKKIFKTVRQRRYEQLRKEYFTKAEAKQLSEFKFKQPYIHSMRLDRRQLARKIRKLNLPAREALTELRWRIKKLYEISGWEDAYAMMRWYRTIALERGEYIPPERKRPRLDKGKVAEQKRRWRARKEAEREGRTGVQFDSAGKVIGWVEYNQETGKFEARNV